MYQVSDELDRVISGSGRTFFARLSGIQDGIQKIKLTSMSTPDNYISVGFAISFKIEVNMYIKSDPFVEGSECIFEIGSHTDQKIEWIPMGTFIVSKSQKDRNLLTFTAYDNMQSKLGETYTSRVASYPAESREFLEDISNQTGVNIEIDELKGNFLIDKIISIDDQSGEKVSKKPFDGFTMQQVVGYIAQLNGMFAVCDRKGNVVFRKYKKVDIPSGKNRILDQDSFAIRDQSGGALYDSNIIYGDGGKIKDSIGDFLLDSEGNYIYDTLKYYETAQTYVVRTNRYFDDLIKSSKKCEIEGIGCSTDTAYFESGGIPNIKIENPVMTQEWLDNVFKTIKDISFFPASFSFMGDPRLDVGDIIVVIDAAGNPIDVPIMSHVLEFDGGLLSSVASYGAEESATYSSPTSIAIQRVRDDILTLQEITAQKATFNQLVAVDAKVTNLQASVITADTANILYARLDKTNIELGWITTAMIGNAQITDAKIDSLTASKITSGTIDASDINVINLNAANITVGKINGKQLSDDVNSSIAESTNTANNALSTANTSVQIVKIEYYSSLSETELIGGSWSEVAPNWVEGKYIWSRNKTITKAGGTTYSNAACITGNTGARGDTGAQGIQGEQGIQGIPGNDGKTTYFHIKYSSISKPTSASQMTETPSVYIGTYVDFIESDSIDPQKYTWSRFEGIQGDKGDQGIPGINGANGQTSYLHIAYANSEDGMSGFSVSDSIGKGYIGQYTDFVSDDSTNPSKYAWTKIKGDTGAQGKGIRSIKDQYYLSTSNKNQIGGVWSDSQPEWVKDHYIWTRSYITWSDDTITTTTPVLAEALNTANSNANIALSTADSKNTAFYQTTQPSTEGRSQNDIWYDTSNGNAMYYFDGKSWVKKVFGDNAIDNLSASKITTGTLDAAKVTLVNLDAGSITTGTITGLDALFNRSFTVNSPYSDTESFIIEANKNNIIIGTRIKDTVYSTNDNSIIFSTGGISVQGGNGNVSISAKSNVTVQTDSGSINLCASGTTETDIPIYAQNDIYSFKVHHDGNTKLKSNFTNGVEIGTIKLGDLSTTLKVPLASNTQSGAITSTEKARINTDYLPLTGGTLKSSNVDVLGLNCTSGTMSTLRFYGSGTRLGSIGFNGQNSKAYRWNASGTAYQLLDENDLKDSGWVNISLASGISTISYIGARVRKIGSIINVIMGVTGATAAFQTLGTLASSYRPPKEVSFAARYYNSPNAGISIGTDGVIKLLATASGGTTYASAGTISFSITYFA